MDDEVGRVIPVRSAKRGSECSQSFRLSKREEDDDDEDDKEEEKEVRWSSGDLNLAKPEMSTKPLTLRYLPKKLTSLLFKK